MRSERLRRDFNGLLRVVHRLDVLPDCRFDKFLSLIRERLTIRGGVNRNTGVLECSRSGKPHADEVAEVGSSSVPNDSSRVYPIHQLVISHLPFSDVSGHRRHTIGNRLQDYKYRWNSYSLQTTECQEVAKSYNTLDCEVRTKRSTSILGNVPGIIPGCRLGLTRFAKLPMWNNASPTQIDVGADSSDSQSVVGRGGVAA